MKYTYYGHSCFSVEIAGRRILFDPFITGNPLAKSIQLSDIQADYILVSHGHQDHTLDLVTLAQQTGAQVVSNFEIIGWLGQQGIGNGHALNHGGKWQFDFGTVKYVNAIHSSSFADGAYAGNPGGFVVDSPEGCFYFTGDTALTLDMELIPRTYKLDFSVMCVGDDFTMGYEDALMAAEMVQCKRVIGVHYDTFEPIRLDRDAARAHFAQAGYELLLPEIGQTIDV